jgi:hypothetical protein
MDITTLDKANALNRKIKEFQQAFNCFQWEEEYGGGSTNPILIIEFAGPDGRETQQLPLKLSDAMVSFLKTEIIKGRDAAVAEFNIL